MNVALAQPGVTHRGMRVDMYSIDGQAEWTVRGVVVMLVQMRGAFWLAPLHTHDDDKFPDDGPYPSAEVAAVSATLQESL